MERPDLSPYLSMPLNAGTQDLYFIRTSIRQALRSQLPELKGDFLDVGCGIQPYREMITDTPSNVTRYVGMDLGENMVSGYRAVKPDVDWDGVNIPLEDASFDSAMATEVLEHCPDPSLVLNEIFRVLRPAGTLFITVPFLWPLHDVPYDEYRYTPFALGRLLNEAGFDQHTIKPLGGWDASLAQMLGLWAMRRPMSDRKRGVVKRITLPLVRYLLKHDHIPDPRSSPMVTGLWALAHKP